MFDTIKTFCKNLYSIICNKNSEYVERTREKGNKLDFINTLFASIKTLRTSTEYGSTKLETKNKISITKTAFIKRRLDKKTYISVKNINDNIINMFYNKNNNIILPYNFSLDNEHNCYIKNNNNKRKDNTLFINKTKHRFVAVDATQYNLLAECVNKENVMLSKSKNYGFSLISGLYDIMNEIPINYHPISKPIEGQKKFNETKGLYEQLDYLTSNDILVGDRWYYSKKLHKALKNKNIGFLFRIKNNWYKHFFENLNYDDIKEVIIFGQRVQICKYKIKNKDYHIITSITEKISVNEIKALYWRRWKIEIEFRKDKYNVLHGNIKSKKINTFLLDIECIRFMVLIESIIEHLGSSNIKKLSKINSTNCIEVLYDDLIELLLYQTKSNKTWKKICRIIGVIYKKIINIVFKKSRDRIRKSPSTKWNVNGNRYGNNE